VEECGRWSTGWISPGGYFPFSWELAPVIDTIWLSEGFARYIAIDALADTMPKAEGAA
jgi:hypothetical protein